jgi:hypothetical protein
MAAIMENALETKGFMELHSGAITILVLTCILLGTALILLPQILRAYQRAMEIQHAERMKALEQGLHVEAVDDRSRATGRMALVVPTVSIITAGMVTCFLVAYGSEHLFSVSLAVWCVGGVVSLAAITGGVALMGRLAQLASGDMEEEEEEIPHPLREK